MFLKTEDLKLKTHELFATDLAREVQCIIDAKDNVQENNLSVVSNGMVSKGINLFDSWGEQYNKIPTGRFTGLPRLYWNNADSFIFSEDEQSPFSYRMASGLVITPQKMPTNGGSTPRILHMFAKYSPWCYGPAFILHDWVFYAKGCHREGFAEWTLEDAADLMAESMKTLMEVGYQDFEGEHQQLEKSELTLLAMKYAVVSDIARELWKEASASDSCYL